MKFAPIFVIQTYMSFANMRKDLCKHGAAQMGTLCHRTEPAVCCEGVLRAYWEYWLLFWTSSYEVGADKLLQSLFPWGCSGTSLFMGVNQNYLKV